MRGELLDKLLCPDCQSARSLIGQTPESPAASVANDDLICTACGKCYPIVDGIAVLLATTFHSPERSADLSPIVLQKRAQIDYFDSVGTSELEIDRPHGCGRVYSFLLPTKFRLVSRLYGQSFAKQWVLDVCCGSGMDAEFLFRAGAQVVGVDISLGALRGAQERARRYGLQYELIVADAECLPFRDRAFDISFVHDGLHHLSDPHAGLAEMLRVADVAALNTEPARALATAVGVRVGIAEAVEESGNQVHRFTEEELRQAFANAGYSRSRFSRYAMFYRQQPLPIFRMFESDPAFAAFRLLYRLINLLIGRWGNKMAAVAER